MSRKTWKSIRYEGLSQERIDRIEESVRTELIRMTLKELREASGKTQVELAELAETTQAQLSKIESRNDHKLSTLRRYVEALGGELEVIARVGGKEIRLTNV
jgi:predicted transcriptional regulator